MGIIAKIIMFVIPLFACYLIFCMLADEFIKWNKITRLIGCVYCGCVIVILFLFFFFFSDNDIFDKISEIAFGSIFFTTPIVFVVYIMKIIIYKVEEKNKREEIAHKQRIDEEQERERRIQYEEWIRNERPRKIDMYRNAGGVFHEGFTCPYCYGVVRENVWVFDEAAVHLIHLFGENACKKTFVYYKNQGFVCDYWASLPEEIRESISYNEANFGWRVFYNKYEKHPDRRN